MNCDLIEPRPGDIAATTLSARQKEGAARCDAVFARLRVRENPVWSHTSALELLGIETPVITPHPELGRYYDEGAAHICTTTKTSRPRMIGVQSHLWPHGMYPVNVMGRFSCVPPVVAWEQMSLWLSVPELITLGDSMMRRDYRLKKASLSDFNERLSKDKSFWGRSKCLRALPLMRENTDSSQETRLRLKMEDFGFKGAVVNLKMINDLTGRPMFFDIAYPDYGFSLEYQGVQHGFHEQWTRDIKKERFLDRIGWVVFPVFADDLNDEASWNTLMASIIAKVGAPKA